MQTRLYAASQLGRTIALAIHQQLLKSRHLLALPNSLTMQTMVASLRLSGFLFHCCSSGQRWSLINTSLVHSFHPLTADRTLSARTIVQACRLGQGLESAINLIDTDGLDLRISIRQCVSESLTTGDICTNENNIYHKSLKTSTIPTI